MSNINQLSSDTLPSLSDQVAIWSQGNGQPRKMSLSALVALVQSSLAIPNGILNSASLYSLKRTQAETLALTTVPAVVAPYDANGGAVLPMGGQSLTQNVVTGLMQATRVIRALDFWIALDGSLPSPRVLTVQVQTGPVGGPLFTSEFQSVGVGTGNAQSFHFAGVLQNPNNINSQINMGDIVQLVASADAATTLTISRVSFIAQPLDGV
jgi:hypothetical protein